MRDVYKKAKYIIWKLCVSVLVFLLMWVLQVVAHTLCVCGDYWNFKPLTGETPTKHFGQCIWQQGLVFLTRQKFLHLMIILTYTFEFM